MGNRLYGTFVPQTGYMTSFAVDLSIAEIVHARPETIGRNRPQVFIHLTPRAPDLAFLVADDASLKPVRPRHHPLIGAIVVARRHDLPEPAMFGFSHPHMHTSLLAHPEFTPDGMAMLVFHGNSFGGWEVFRLVAPAGVPISVQYQLDLIDRALKTPPFAIPNLLRDANPNERAVFAGLLTSTLSPTGAELLASYLLEDPERLREFAALLPQDLWAVRALPDLQRFLSDRAARLAHSTGDSKPVDWLPPPMADKPAIAAPPRGLLGRVFGWGRPHQPNSPEVPTLSPAQSKPPDPTPPSTSRTVGLDLDGLAIAGAEGSYTSLGHRCAVTARRAVPPIKTLCIVAAMRNEGLYLLDWVAYHRSIGVDRIFVYTNNNTDGSDGLLQALADAGEIVLFDNRLAVGVPPQSKAYGHVLSMVPDILDYRWCAIIDGDEYLGFDTSLFGSITEYLAWQEFRPVDTIALNWNMVAPCGAIRWQDEPLPFRFRQRCPGIDLHVKSISRPRFFQQATPHVPVADGHQSLIARDAVGEPRVLSSPFAAIPRDTHAWIAHYFFRSVEEYIWKWSRGRGDDLLSLTTESISISEHFLGAFISQFRLGELVDDGRMALCAEGLLAERERLLRVRGVAAARGEILAAYRRRSASLPSELRKLREAASPLEAEFYDLLLVSESA